MAKCKCGCGQTVNRTWVPGHNKLSASDRKKISKALKGLTLSIETRKKMSEVKCGENNGGAILTEKDVLDIQFLYKDELERRYHEGKKCVSRGFPQELAHFYGVSPNWISVIGHHRRAWQHLDTTE